MTVFQIIALSLLAFLGLQSALNLVKRRGRMRVNLLWIALWLIGGLGIAQPRWTARIAQEVGIGRGADLIFYLGILTMLTGFFYTYLRMRRMERGLTLVTRRLAITEAELGRNALVSPPDLAKTASESDVHDH